MLHLKWQTVIYCAVAVLIIGWMIGSVRNTSIIRIPTVRERHDTAHVTLTLPLPAVNLRAAANRHDTLRIHDTIFTARCLDTVIASDTLSVCYVRDVFAVSLRFAERRMAVAIPYVARDSIVTEFITRPWYEDVLMVIVSVAAGMLLRKL